MPLLGEKHFFPYCFSHYVQDKRLPYKYLSRVAIITPCNLYTIFLLKLTVDKWSNVQEKKCSSCPIWHGCNKNTVYCNCEEVVQSVFKQTNSPGGQYGLDASLERLSCTLSLLVPIWNPFIAWIAACALTGLSQDTKPEQYEQLIGSSFSRTTTNCFNDRKKIINNHI